MGPLGILVASKPFQPGFLVCQVPFGGKLFLRNIQGKWKEFKNAE